MIRPTLGSDCKARAAPPNESQVAAPLENLVYVCICAMLTFFGLELKPDVSCGCYITEVVSTISITTLNIP